MMWTRRRFLGAVSASLPGLLAIRPGPSQAEETHEHGAHVFSDEVTYETVAETRVNPEGVAYKVAVTRPVFH